MKKHIMSLPNQLDELVAEGGDNFSAGQRQLICIGRALLRRPKILVLDEATASIDNETDDLVQRVVRQIFKSATGTVSLVQTRFRLTYNVSLFFGSADDSTPVEYNH